MNKFLQYVKGHEGAQSCKVKNHYILCDLNWPEVINLVISITASILQKKPKEKQSQPAEKLTEEDATFTSERKRA